MRADILCGENKSKRSASRETGEEGVDGAMMAHVSQES